MLRRKINSIAMQVMKYPCKSCPFEGSEPIDLHPQALEEYKKKIIRLESQHECHSVNNEKLCRGGRNLLLKTLYLKGFIAEETDECFIKTMKEILHK